MSHDVNNISLDNNDPYELEVKKTVHIKKSNKRLVVYRPLSKDSIKWDDMNSRISPNFKLNEALLLRDLDIYHNPDLVEKLNILQMAANLESIREYMGEMPIMVTSWIRPLSINCPSSKYHGKNYNWIGARSRSRRSCHIKGGAVDWRYRNSSGNSCNNVRKELVPILKHLGIRLENNKNGNWIHIDKCKVKFRRFFNP